MTQLTHTPLRAMLAACMIGAAVVPAFADEGGRGLRTPPLPSYRQECAACHVAYPPGLLPATSWQRLLGDLKNHYGSDASLDPATRKALQDWLVANAGSSKRLSEPPPQDRITRSAWFAREHREVAAGAWRSPAVKSAANCTACHAQAEQGDFNEHDVRIPR